MMSVPRVFVCVLLGVCGPLFSCGFSACPCEDPTLCNPIISTPKKEIFIFSLSDSPAVWANYNWSLITTVVAARSVHDELMCLAHKHGARIVAIADYSPTSALANVTQRQTWIKQKKELVSKHYLDGINFDFEDEIPKDRQDLRDGYTLLVSETRQILSELNPFIQVTVDVAWSPAHIDSRYYDYAGLASASDFLFVMSYDERSQIFGSCVAAANSGYPTTMGGLKQYLQLPGVPGSKLVLGVPWYGYQYPCVTLYKNNTCVIPFHPWRGVNCSDAAGTQQDYVDILNILQASTTGRLWDRTSQSPFFNFRGTSDLQMYQMWYDDPESLKIKYGLVRTLGLRGAGMWQADTLDNSDTPQGRQQRQEMWGALTAALD